MNVNAPEKRLGSTAAQWMYEARRSAGRAWRASRSSLLVLALLIGAAGTLKFAFLWRNEISVNEAIRSLGAGHTARVTADAAPELLLAQIMFLTQRDDVDQARAFVDALERNGSATLCAKARYVLANALLRKAFDLIERGDLDAAGPFVNLSKREYRRALHFVPQFWVAKFNFDVTSRLVRDFPKFEQENGDELSAEPKKLWTDVPGTPKGLP